MDLSNYEKELELLRDLKSNTDLILDLDKVILFLTDKLYNTKSFNTEDLELLTNMINYKTKYIDNLKENTDKILENI